MKNRFDNVKVHIAQECVNIYLAHYPICHWWGI